MISQQYAMVSWRDAPIEGETRMAIRGKDVVTVNMVDGLEEWREDIQRVRERGLSNLLREHVESSIDTWSLKQARIGSLGSAWVRIEDDCAEEVVKAPLHARVEDE